MLFWFIAIAVTAIACAALYFAAGPRVAKSLPTDDDTDYLGLVLAGIEADLAAGKMAEAEAIAAKGELAREVLRLRADAGRSHLHATDIGRGPLMAGLVGVAAVAFAIYAVLGSPNLPAQPLADRQQATAEPVDLEDAIGRIETRLAQDPDDLRGWSVVAPAYMELGRYGDAVRAYRRIIELDAPSADLQTSLAEALMFEADGQGSSEALQLLEAAAASDSRHVLSRLYIAAELTRQARYDEAVSAWTAALALSNGDEPWLASAREGLAVAQGRGVSAPDAEQSAMIGQMVSGLAARLATDGGTVEEWTQLVRAYLVLGDQPQAQAAFDGAVAAYPLAFDRGELDTLALGAGLTINGATP